jgi:hypothetical protein
MIILVSFSFCNIIGCFIMLRKHFNKFDYLDPNIQRKSYLLYYYMAPVTQLTDEELIEFGKLSDEEIEECNIEKNSDICIELIKKKIKMIKKY